MSAFRRKRWPSTIARTTPVSRPVPPDGLPLGLTIEFNTAGENLRCPTDAIVRTYVEDPYFEYKIDEDKCIGCGKCVKGCASFGNGSLFLQVRRHLCKDCNECRIAKVCPSGAFTRVPADKPYIFRRPPEVKS